MTLQSSGAISINNINTELGSASGTPRSLGDSSSRNLAGVPSGPISLSNFYGKSNVQEVIFDNSGGAWGNWQDQNLWNIFVYLGIAITSNKVKVILRNITITSSSIGIAAIETGSGWPAGTHLEVVIESTSAIYGRGGTGGVGTASNVAGNPGGAGGRALTITSAISGGSITITNQGAIRAGGGGGGAGGRGMNYIGGDAGGCTAVAGGNGGNGAGSTGTAGAVAAATAGVVPLSPRGPGGNGGTYGANGVAGGAGVRESATCASAMPGGAGGAAGSSIINSGLATINNTGTIAGALA